MMDYNLNNRNHNIPYSKLIFMISSKIQLPGQKIKNSDYTLQVQTSNTPEESNLALMKKTM